MSPLNGNSPLVHDLAATARRYLSGIAAGEEEVRTLYLQPDRAVFLAAQSGIVVKVYAEHDLLRRDWEFARLARSAGLPTAEPLAFDPGPPALFAMRRVFGQPLGAGHTAAGAAGAFLARFHRLEAQPPFPSGQLRWDDHIATSVEYVLADLEPRHIFDARRLTHFRRCFAARQSRLARRPISLLHGDLQPAHVMVDERGERVVAFLDFADAGPGDPLFDLAVLTLNDETLVAPLLAGYATIPDDAETRELIATYRLLRHLGSIPWLLDRNFDQNAARSIAAVEATAW